MNPEQIAALLQKTVESALNKTTPTSEDKTGVAQSEAIANLAKVVTAMNDKLENLDKTAMKNEPETVETQVEKLSKTVESLAGLVAKVAKGEKLDEADEPMDFSKMTKSQFNELVLNTAKGIVTGKKGKEMPEGEGKEDITTILKSIAAGNSDEEIDIDLDDIETEDVAGNQLNKKSRSSRKALDDWFGKKLGSSVERHLGVDEDDGEEEVEDGEDDS